MVVVIANRNKRVHDDEVLDCVEVEANQRGR